jgi:hypothetical protein
VPNQVADKSRPAIDNASNNDIQHYTRRRTCHDEHAVVAGRTPAPNDLYGEQSDATEGRRRRNRSHRFGSLRRLERRNVAYDQRRSNDRVSVDGESHGNDDDASAADIVPTDHSRRADNGGQWDTRD